MTNATALRLAETPVRYDVSLSASAGLAEPPPEPLNESELSWIWAGQRYPAGALNLVDGRRLTVMNPGRPGLGSGPDFLDAVLEIDGERVCGDVELHVRSSGFRAHGHDTDPAYDNVALHVVFRADESTETRLSNGTLAPIAAFAPWFDSRRDELQGWLGADALWREPCRDAVWRLGEPATRSLLHEAGLARFEVRVAAVRSLSEEAGAGEALWRSLFDVLGVGGDREGFRRLANVFPLSLASAVTSEPRAHADPQTALTSALLHAAGLAPAPETACAFPPPLRPALAGAGRPANRPERRLAGIAALYVRAGGDLPAMARRSVIEAVLTKNLIAGWQVSHRDVALIGPDRAREIVTNLVLPFTATEAGLRVRSLELLDGLGAATPYGKTAFLEGNLRGSGRRFVRGALEQQGLLAFLGQWCSQGGCGHCPLS